jgi:hypothetical protein
MRILAGVAVALSCPSMAAADSKRDVPDYDGPREHGYQRR